MVVGGGREGRGGGGGGRCGGGGGRRIGRKGCVNEKQK